jgi:mono/diheme cytochrome c family protein
MKKTLIIGIVIVLAIAGVLYFRHGGGSSSIQASVERGGKVYTQYCLSCHQAKGSGVPGLNPPLKNSPYVQGDESRLIEIVLNGKTEGVEINGETYTNPMPPFGATLKDEEIADVLTYVRNSFGNKAAAIKVSQVKAERE